MITQEASEDSAGPKHVLTEYLGTETVIDLAALDPITLASIFKRFLAMLPDPVLTGHLFHLFIATSHIKNVWVRKRAMHLVICMMPKVVSAPGGHVA